MNQGVAIQKGGYRRWIYHPDYSGDDEEMEREQMIGIEQFENKSKNESCHHRYQTWL